MLNDAEIISLFKDAGIETTLNPFEAIYVLSNGTLISGMFYGNTRGEDHRCAECLFDDIDRYSPNFWDKLLRRTGMIMLIPETEQAVLLPTQPPTAAQRRILDILNYEIIRE